MKRYYRNTPDSDFELLFALAQAGAFGPQPIFSESEIARVMGVRPGSVNMCIRGAFQKLRRNPELWRLLEDLRVPPTFRIPPPPGQ